MKSIYTVLLLFISSFIFSQEWEQIASLPEGFGTDHSFAFAIDGVGYIMAGNTPSGYSSSFYSYDATVDEWTQKEDFPGGARGFAIGEVHNGKAYFGFGIASGNMNLDDLWEYDPVQDSWRQLANCECDARFHPAMVALDNKLYVGLGGSSSGNRNDFWVYDIDTDEWEELSRFPAAERHHPFQFTDGEYVYVGFGHGNGFISNQWYRYNTETDTWLEVKRLPAEGRVAGTQLSYNGVGLILSGDGDDHRQMETGEFWVYEPIFDSWKQMPAHPGLSRWAPASFIINDEFYLLNGERNGDYLKDNFKYDISGLNAPELRLLSSDAPINYEITDGECNANDVRMIQAGTRVPFDEDIEITIEVDANSNAVEGRDFILLSNSATLPAGENIVEFEIILFDDAVVSDDKSLVINLVSDQNIGKGQVFIDLRDDDQLFSTESLTRELQVGEGSAQSIAPFSRFYTNARSQMLYRKELLSEAGVADGLLDRIAFEVQSEAGQSFTNLTIGMAHTDVSELDGAPINSINFQEVYRNNYNNTMGINELVLDTPFDYDSDRNLIIEICFDNNDYTTDDVSTATDVGYNSTVTVLADFVNGCPQDGQVVSTSFLPNMTIYREGFFPLYEPVNQRFQSEISGGESLYFSSNDSIYAIVDNIDDGDVACISSELVANSREVKTLDDIDWVDKIYYFQNEGGEANQYEVTLIVPKVEGIDYDSENLSGLYNPNEIDPSGEIDWTIINSIEIQQNEEYIFLKIPYQGTGFYAIGGFQISTSTIDFDSDFSYDNVTVFDMMGRAVYTGKQKPVLSEDLPAGVYIYNYTLNNVQVSTEKIFVR